MQIHRLLRACITIALCVFTSNSALADDAVNQSRIISSPTNSPVHLQGCPATSLGYPYGRVEVRNRTTAQMVRVAVHFRFFDDGGQLLGQGTQEWRDTGLESGENGVFSYSFFNMQWQGSNVTDTRSVSCEIVMAKFATGKIWKKGQLWRGTLLREASTDGPASNVAAGAAALHYAILRSWTTTGKSGDFYLHVRVSLTAGKTETVQASNFRLTVALSNGATKNYTGLNEQSPLVLRGGLLEPTGSSTDYTPAIAKAEDLGYIGHLTIEPGTPVVVVVTYHILDQPATQNAFRAFQWIRSGV